MLPVTVAGHELSEFCAKMQSYPVISACEVDASVFQGVNRSSMQLLHNRRGARYMDCKIDFFGDNYERTLHQSEFEALFLGTEPVIIDIGDGFWYRAVLTKIDGTETERELITTVEYRFQVTRHRGQQVIAAVTPNDAAIWCQSNVPKTDCVIQLAAQYEGAKTLTVQLNGYSWHMAGFSGSLVLDGVNKIFLIDGENANSRITWSDFPFLVPGENRLSVFVEGTVPAGLKAMVAYTATYL